MPYRSKPCNIVIIGASGDLTRRKLIPALFSLYCNELLPDQIAIIGFARSDLDDQKFRDAIVRSLTCRYEPEQNKCHEKMNDFLDRCFYVCGNYNSVDSFVELKTRIQEIGFSEGNTLFYMAIPPTIFIDSANSIHHTYTQGNPSQNSWSRIVIEKPFGRDSESSKKLINSLSEIFDEEQIYRIDHYLGKEVIQNLMILRFANLIFEPLWNNQFIESVSISWTEKIGCEGRAGYFDNYGIIRDVMQNHLMQIVALVGMERPDNFRAECICDKKVELLRSVNPIDLDNITVGQYVTAMVNGKSEPGYLDDPDVPDDSITETYARAILAINNSRWEGVPFYLTAGKALSSNMTEIRISFKKISNSIFNNHGEINSNSLVIRVQPNEAIELNIINKLPGLDQQLEEAKLNLHYASAFQQIVPDAYERLILDVLRGDRSLFIRADELDASWNIVTPILNGLEQDKIKPEPYAFGSSGAQ